MSNIDRDLNDIGVQFTQLVKNELIKQKLVKTGNLLNSIRFYKFFFSFVCWNIQRKAAISTTIVLLFC